MSHGNRPSNCNARVVEAYIIDELGGRLEWQGGRKHAAAAIQLPNGTKLTTQISRATVDGHDLRTFVRQAVQRAQRGRRA